MDFHEAAEIFPLDEEHIDELAKDIQEHGLLVPIEVIDGKIIDGRRRWLACEKAGIEADWVEVHPDDPVAYVLSLNLHRRHLTITQLGVAAGKADALRARYDTEAKERMAVGQKSGGRGHKKNSEKISSQSFRAPQSRDELGRAFGISGNTVEKGRRVIQDAIVEVVEAAEQNRISINIAEKLARLPAAEQKPALQESLQPRSSSPRSIKRTAPEADELPEGVSRGIGVRRANEAIDCLRRIPKNDRLRKRGFQIVTDWIRRNR